jgi:hypothetical protein
MESKEKYLQFPLFLLRELLTDKEKTIEKIIKYGIYRFSKIQKYELYDVAKQIMYCYYRKQGDLTNNLLEITQSYIDAEMIDLDEDYSGFSFENFNPETEINQLLEIFETDLNFKEKSIEFYLIRQAYVFLGITGNFENCLKVGKQIEKTIPEKEPFPMISKRLLFEFRDNDKSEFDLMQFAVYIAIRSILGKKSYCKTNKEMIICRSFGYASKKHLPAKMHPIIKELFSKYMKRYHINNLIESLKLNWKVLIYSKYIRGFYVGMSNKISLEAIILIAETKKKKNQIATLKRNEFEIREKVLQQLNKKTAP